MARSKPIPVVRLDLARKRKALLSRQQHEQAIAWYPTLHAKLHELAAESGFSVEQLAGTIALYSINATWRANWLNAYRAIRHGFRGGIGGAINIPGRVSAILDHGEPIDDCLTSRRKVRAFAASMLLQDACCIDRHMYRVYSLPEHNPERYYGAAECATRYLAREDRLPVWAEQSLLWASSCGRPDVAVWEQ